MSFIRDIFFLFSSVLIMLIILFFGDFIRNPEKYGEIVGRFDTVRFGIGSCEP